MGRLLILGKILSESKVETLKVSGLDPETKINVQGLSALQLCEDLTGEPLASGLWSFLKKQHQVKSAEL